jgi:hypothetical protein
MQTRPMTDRRATPRHNMFRDGTIEFDGGAVHCKIRNISRMGASLEPSSSAIVPHELSLIMVDGRVSQHCYVVWRGEKRIGVRFDCSSRADIDPLALDVITPVSYRTGASNDPEAPANSTPGARLRRRVQLMKGI